MTLTKADIVQEVYKNHNLTKAQANEAVESLLRLSKDTLIKGSDLLLSGFGKFNVRDHCCPKQDRNVKMMMLILLGLEAENLIFSKPGSLFLF